MTRGRPRWADGGSGAGRASRHSGLGIRADGPAAGGPREVHRRLLALAGGRVRAGLVVAVACGGLGAAALVVQAWVVADAVAGAVDGRTVGTGALLVLAAVVVGRALLAAALELVARASAASAMRRLRERLADRALAGRAEALDGARRGEVVTAAVHGVDALADYYARAVPALALAAAVPAGMVVAIGWRLPLVGALLAVTLPVVVVFMVLVGRRSAAHARERRTALAVLGSHFLEVVRGLPTLRAHGRDGAQAPALERVADRYRDESLAALRVAFLSALVLELLAMLGTAIAAAVVGVLLAEGRADLSAGLFVLLLAPEVYAPLRDAGQRFHAAEDGAQAARRLLAALDAPGPLRTDGPSLDDEVGPVGGSERAPDPLLVPLRSEGAGVRGGDGRPDALAPVDLTVEPGRSLALVGPSGSGKSTLLALLARLRDPDVGGVRCGDLPLTAIAPEDWWTRVSWLAQRPRLPSGRLGDALGGPAGSDGEARLLRAMRRVAILDLVADLPGGLDLRLEPDDRRLSAGQLQRLALAGALASRAPLLLLDEPTAHLDPDAAARARDAIMAAAEGRTLVVATHDRELAARCDRVLPLADADARSCAADRTRATLEPAR